LGGCQLFNNPPKPEGYQCDGSRKNERLPIIPNFEQEQSRRQARLIIQENRQIIKYFKQKKQ